MARLFVAVDLPEEITAELARMQPKPMSGLRNVKADQMHLTLHFIGEAEVAVVAAALAPVTGLAFELVLDGVGRFPPAGKAKVLWVGLRENAELVNLHDRVGKALVAAGFPIESRAYAPHITLSRCGYKVSAEAVEQFLARNRGFSTGAIPVMGFALYSSTSTDEGPVYRREKLFPLTVPG